MAKRKSLMPTGDVGSSGSSRSDSSCDSASEHCNQGCLSFFGYGDTSHPAKKQHSHASVLDAPVSTKNRSSNLSVLSLPSPSLKPLKVALAKNDVAAIEKAKQAEAMMVQELNALSIRERQRVYEDVHGITDRTRETPQLVRDTCRKLQNEIRKIKQRPAYYKATFLRPGKFTSQDFCLPFLRAEDFNAKNAARRIVDYFQLKLELFGLDKLCKDITLDDLTDDDLAYIRTGRVQVLGTDRIGRPIIVAFSRRRAVYNTIDTVARVYWYLFEAAMEFPDATKYGLVLMLYDAGVADDCQHESEMFRQYKDMGFLRIGARFLACHPLTLTAVHFCFDNPMLAAPMSAVQHVIGRRGRVRYRAHHGSFMECLYILRTFGINTEFPVDGSTGHVLVDKFHRWLDERRRIENRRESERRQRLSVEGYVEIPSTSDVLLGRGRPFQEYPGNLHLADIVDQSWEQYQQSRMKEKQALTVQIVQQLNAEGRRFLKKVKVNDSDEYWTEVTAEKAREKVSHAFRNNTVHRKESGQIPCKSPARSNSEQKSSQPAWPTSANSASPVSVETPKRVSLESIASAPETESAPSALWESRTFPPSASTSAVTDSFVGGISDASPFDVDYLAPVKVEDSMNDTYEDGFGILNDPDLMEVLTMEEI